MGTLRIENAHIVTMTEHESLSEGVLIAHDGQIAYVGPAAQAPADDGHTEILDGSGCVLLPGLVNAHTHAAMTLFRGFGDDMPLLPWLQERIWPAESKLTAEDVYWGTMLGIVEMLRAGVTCMCDMYHHFEAGTRAAVDGGIRAAPSGVLLGFDTNAQDVLARAVDFAVSFKDDATSRITPMLGPHAPYTCPDDLLERVVKAAGENNLRIHIHLSETAQEVADSLSQHGETPTRHMERIGLFEAQVTCAHCVHLNDEDIEIVARHGVGCVHCPSSNMKLASGFARIPEMIAAGAVVGLGTDGAASNNNLDLLGEARLAALIHKGRYGDPTVVKACEALHMATVGGARALGLADRVGTLEVGKRCDCILVEMNTPHNQPLFDVYSQLVYAAHCSDVKTAVVDGDVVLRDRVFTRLDEEKIMAEAVSRAFALQERVQKDRK